MTEFVRCFFCSFGGDCEDTYCMGCVSVEPGRILSILLNDILDPPNCRQICHDVTYRKTVSFQIFCLLQTVGKFVTTSHTGRLYPSRYFASSKLSANLSRRHIAEDCILPDILPPPNCRQICHDVTHRKTVSFEIFCLGMYIHYVSTVLLKFQFKKTFFLRTWMNIELGWDVGSTLSQYTLTFNSG